MMFKASSLTDVFSGTAMAPAHIAPSMAVTMFALLFIRMPMRAPSPQPAAIRPLATRSTASLSAPQLSVASGAMTAGFCASQRPCSARMSGRRGCACDTGRSRRTGEAADACAHPPRAIN